MDWPLCDKSMTFAVGARFGVRHVSEAVWTDGQSPIPAHTTADASLRYSWKSGDTADGLGFKGFSVRLNIDNLFNQQWTYKYKTGFPFSTSNPGLYVTRPRTLFLGVEATF